MSVSRETEDAASEAICTAFDVSRETQARLTLYAALLRRWNERINLISRADIAHLWPRHIADSLQLLPLLPKLDRAIDLGSGGGFPGLILALCSGVAFDLIEADQRKAAFLREAARVTQAPVRIHACRIEAADCAPAQLVTARALAPLPRLLALAHPLLAPGGVCLFLKGAQGDGELIEAGTAWTMRVQRHISRAGDGIILRLSEVARVGQSSAKTNAHSGDRQPEGRRG